MLVKVVFPGPNVEGLARSVPQVHPVLGLLEPGVPKLYDTSVVGPAVGAGLVALVEDEPVAAPAQQDDVDVETPPAVKRRKRQEKE